MVESVDAKTLKHWLDLNQVMLVDVRELDEYQDAHIAEAIHCPLAMFSLSQLPLSEGEKKVVIHCRSGKRSDTACHHALAENSQLQVYNLQGGILAWIAQGYPVRQITASRE